MPNSNRGNSKTQSPLDSHCAIARLKLKFIPKRVWKEGCVSYFSHHSNRVPNRNNLKTHWLWLTGKRIEDIPHCVEEGLVVGTTSYLSWQECAMTTNTNQEAEFWIEMWLVNSPPSIPVGFYFLDIEPMSKRFCSLSKWYYQQETYASHSNHKKEQL